MPLASPPLASFPLVARTIHTLEIRTKPHSPHLRATESRARPSAGGVRPTVARNHFRSGRRKSSASNVAVSTRTRTTKTPLRGPTNAFPTSLEQALLAPMWTDWWIRCADWKLTSKWRYAGPIHAKQTSYPLVLVSNQFDPVCPLRVTHARREQERFGDAVGVLALSVYCQANTRVLIVNGTLPGEGTVYEADELPFVGRTRAVRTLSSGG